MKEKVKDIFAAVNKSADNMEKITDWFVEQVREHYADDVAVIVSHKSLYMTGQNKRLSYFVYRTPRGAALAKTFIIDGFGYDIWGMDWNRLESFAALNEYNITCLADSELLYANTEEDAERFNALKVKQKRKLTDKKEMRRHALEAYAQAKNIYLEAALADESDAKMGFGYCMDYLSQAYVYENCMYFTDSQTNQIEELKQLSDVPEQFLQLYDEVLRETQTSLQMSKLLEMIKITAQYLKRKFTDSARHKEHNFQDLADWYGELAYTWRRIDYYTEKGDYQRVYMWGIFLQNELNQVCSDFDLKKCPIFSVFDAKNLSTFREKALEVERYIRSVILQNNAMIHEYKTVEECLGEI